ncbi:DUF6766 family protein [Candidatus Phyllobacterium onerii]|uniref:DUF6766 family protein n=1 Tax=Candidatus Phyllobacterium onerii TaxID=3020828 RepID=UPI002FEDE8C1
MPSSPSLPCFLERRADGSAARRAPGSAGPGSTTVFRSRHRKRLAVLLDGGAPPIKFVGHFLASNAASNADALAHGDETKSLLEYLGSSQLWFESFQNWQSEFFSTGMLVVLSIYLRFKGSPESKGLDAGHDETGA